MGLPFAFAAHFAPDALGAALRLYRSSFRPSAQLAAPHVIVAFNVVAADTDEEARRLFTSLQQAFVSLRRGTPGLLQPPLDDISAFASRPELAGVEHALRYAVVGSPTTVEQGLATLVAETGADELLLTAQIYDQEARRRSFALVADVRDRLGARRAAA